MTVKELIEDLQKMPPDSKINIESYAYSDKVTKVTLAFEALPEFYNKIGR